YSRPVPRCRRSLWSGSTIGSIAKPPTWRTTMLMTQQLLRIARLAGLLASCILVCAAKPAPAQSWPQRTVKFIVPLGPGSGTDVGARLFADRLAAHWKKAVV